MILKKLLAAASIVALSAGSAQALSIANQGATSGVVPVQEMAFPTPSGVFTFDLHTDTGTYPSANNVTVVVTLPAGVSFAAAVSGANVTAGLDGFLGSAILQSGGGIGQNAATFLVSIVPSTTGLETDIGFTFTLRLDSCATPGTALTITANIDGSGTPIESGTASTTGTIAPCVNGFVTTINRDDVGTTDDTVISFASAPPFTTLVNRAAATNAASQIGDVSVAIATPGHLDLAKTQITAADIGSLAFNVVFENTAGINAMNTSDGALAFPGGANAPCVGPASNVFACTITGAGIVPLTVGPVDRINITATGAGGVAIASQTVNAASAVLTFANALLVPSETGGLSGGNDSPALDQLARNGQLLGFFDWSPEAGFENRVIRLTGFAAPFVDVPYTITLANARGGAAFEGNFQGTIPAAAITAGNGEVTISSHNWFGLGLGAAWDTAGALAGITGFDRADVQLNLETGDPIDADCKVSSNGTVNNFGDGCNADVFFFAPNNPNTDSDDARE
jgi:hypothetical protein